MTEIELAYGQGSVAFAYDEQRYSVLAQPLADEPPLSDAAIGAALDAPIASPPLEEILSSGESVLLVVSDATRATASAQIVNLLVRRLIQLGIAPDDIAIIFAAGIHRPVTQKEKIELLTPFIVQRIKTIDHNANDRATLLRLGETACGKPIELNRALKEFSHVIVTGAVGFHYFAGFSGGRKSICPGLASADTIAATHMLALDFEHGGRRAGVGTGLLDGNAVHEECERIAALINPSFSINTIVDEKGRAVRLYGGHWRAAHRQACGDYSDNHTIMIASKRDVVIASCGGSPWDINLVQAHKAMDMAAQACNQGGTIVLLAECGDGLGRPDFLKWFAQKDSRSLESLLREAYEVNGQTAWSLLTKAEAYRIYLISELADEDVRSMRMIPARTLNDALRDTKETFAGYILPRGASMLPVTRD
jgi:nickel-dependent lactate racemase